MSIHFYGNCTEVTTKLKKWVTLFPTVTQCLLHDDAQHLVGWICSLCRWNKQLLWAVIKQLIIISSHSTLKWDKPFYKYAALKPIIKVVERIIITPSFHHSHHRTSYSTRLVIPTGILAICLVLGPTFWNRYLSNQLSRGLWLTPQNRRQLDSSLLLPFCKLEGQKKWVAQRF